MKVSRSVLESSGSRKGVADFNLYLGWSNPVRASWVYERRITALLGR